MQGAGAHSAAAVVDVHPHSHPVKVDSLKFYKSFMESTIQSNRDEKIHIGTYKDTVHKIDQY